MQSRQSDIDNPDFDIHTLGSIVRQIKLQCIKLIAELEAKVSEKFKALGETKMNLPTTNVFDWTRMQVEMLISGPPSSMQTNVGQTQPLIHLIQLIQHFHLPIHLPKDQLNRYLKCLYHLNQVNNTIPTNTTDTINPDATYDNC